MRSSPAGNVAPPPTATITTTTPRPRPRGLPLCDQAPLYMQLLPPPPPRPRPQTTSCRRSSDFTTHLQRETPQNLRTDHKLSEIQQPQHTPAKRESCKNLPPNSAAHTCKKITSCRRSNDLNTHLQKGSPLRTAHSATSRQRSSGHNTHLRKGNLLRSTHSAPRTM